MPRPLIWIFGNAVQDITVEVDVDMLIRENDALVDSLKLTETPIIKAGLSFKTQLGARGFGVKLDLEDGDFPPEDSKNYSLRPGKKYTLSGRVDSLDEKSGWRGDPNAVVVHCEDISWGGGGINVCRFIRALAPSRKNPRLRYTDYAMSRTLKKLVENFEAQLLRGLPPKERKGITWGAAAERIHRLMQSNMRVSEALTSNLSHIFAAYSPDTSLEVFLASIFVDSMLFRPQEPVFRRNWVFSRFQSADRSVRDKIVCRSKTASEDELGVQPEALRMFLAGDHDKVGAIVLNSLKDERLFKAAYMLSLGIYEKHQRRHERDFVGVLAMTKAMQEAARGSESHNQIVPWLLSNGLTSAGKLPSFVLIFNEEEAISFAKILNPDAQVEPIIRAPGDLPNVLHFARFVTVVREHFAQPCPRIYVTIGPRGSLGFDGWSNEIVHVSYYSRLGDLLYDTNACGDAYCAAITLLEWAKRNSKFGIGPNDPTEEMRYFMAVATAAAYCKARDRRGRIDVKTVKDLLQDTYLGSGVAGHIDAIVDDGRWESWIDSDGRAHRPPTADFRGVTQGLLELFRGQ